MNLVIPMAGAGSRFSQAGYALPKPLLPAHGKTLLEWSVDSIPLSLVTRMVFVGLESQRKDIEGLVIERYAAHEPDFVWLPQVTRGQAETVMKAERHLDHELGLIIFNIDTAFDSPSLAGLLSDTALDGVLGSFHSDEDRFSFAKLDGNGKVTEVREKDPISNHALTGFYHFSRCSDFLIAAGNAIARNETQKGEFYVAPLYNELIAKGREFVIDVAKRHRILGTPAEYESFLVDGWQTNTEA
jgi:dTDP-glucose pyrophosphorylase